MKAIETRDLTKQFKDRVAVDHLNLSVEQGDFFSLLGQNGAGKTTTIKMLCCLLTPTSGDAELLGDSIVKNPQAVKQKKRRRNIRSCSGCRIGPKTGQNLYPADCKEG